jgi:hypothetical protein
MRGVVIGDFPHRVILLHNHPEISAVSSKGRLFDVKEWMASASVAAHAVARSAKVLTSSLRAKRSNPAFFPRKEKKEESWIASSQALLAMTLMDSRHAFESRDAFRPRFAIKFPCPPIRGRGECRAPDAPDSRVCNG